VRKSRCGALNINNIIKNASEVVIKNGFECEKGAALVIE